MKNIFYTLFCLVSLFLFKTTQAQQSPIRNNYVNDTDVPHLQIERSMIYAPDKEWLYNHHAAIIEFKGKLIATWSNGLIDEDSPGQRVVFSVSKDFKKWSTPAVLSEPSKAGNGLLKILTATGFYKYRDTLVAYYGEYEKDRSHTRLLAKTSTDGEQWSAPIDLHIPAIPNHGPQAIKNGRLIISGNFTFPYTDNPNGISGWKMSSFYPDSLYTEDNPATFYKPAEKLGLPPLCEGSFFQTDDGIIHMLLRVTGKGWKGKLWLTESKDNGAHWSRPIETNFSDNDSKFHFGRLPDNRFYYMGIPDTLHHYDRNPLVIALSENGKFFNKEYVVANELYKIKKEGLWKGGQYGYPHTMIWDGDMYVIISRQKEAIEILRFKLNQLK